MGPRPAAQPYGRFDDCPGWPLDRRRIRYLRRSTMTGATDEVGAISGYSHSLSGGVLPESLAWKVWTKSQLVILSRAICVGYRGVVLPCDG